MVYARYRLLQAEAIQIAITVFYGKNFSGISESTDISNNYINICQVHYFEILSVAQSNLNWHVANIIWNSPVSTPLNSRTEYIARSFKTYKSKIKKPNDDNIPLLIKNV